ncbi:unnamed protein product [Periconia digitata]|uniref:Uncharacterized protein n=1 Tax=Periconia digitata TaxID=1303443 RepID=A0A9W4UAY5_9PLEO|nr:unnamed protein product [Periconia digitata]
MNISHTFTIHRHRISALYSYSTRIHGPRCLVCVSHAEEETVGRGIGVVRSVRNKDRHLGARTFAWACRATLIATMIVGSCDIDDIKLRSHTLQRHGNHSLEKGLMQLLPILSRLNR